MERMEEIKSKIGCGGGEDRLEGKDNEKLIANKNRPVVCNVENIDNYVVCVMQLYVCNLSACMLGRLGYLGAEQQKYLHLLSIFWQSTEKKWQKLWEQYW